MCSPCVIICVVAHNTSRVHLQTWLEGRRFQVRSTVSSHVYPRRSHTAGPVDLVCRILVSNLNRRLDRFLYVPRAEAVQDGITTVWHTVNELRL